MKKLLYTITITWFFNLSGTAQNWELLGSSLEKTVNLTCLALDNNGHLYAIYDNINNSFTLNAKKYSGENWSVAGKDFSLGYNAKSVTFAADKKGVLYVGYKALLKGGEKAIIQKYEDGAWKIVGGDPAEGSVSEGTIMGSALAFDNNNTPYFAYGGQKEQKLMVKKFDGTAWIPLPSPQDQSPCDQVKLAFDNNNDLYAVFLDTKDGKKLTVKKFDGKGGWKRVGKTTVTDAEARCVSFELDSKGVPFLAYQSFGGSIEVKKLIGANWTLLGGSPISPSNSHISLALDNKDIPYISYQNGKGQVEVIKMEGDTWVPVGQPESSVPGYTTLLYSKKNNALYLAHKIADKGANVRKITL